MSSTFFQDTDSEELNQQTHTVTGVESEYRY